MVLGAVRGTKGGPTNKRADPALPETWRGEHYDMTLRRRIFEQLYKGIGYPAIFLAVPVAWLGFDMLERRRWRYGDWQFGWPVSLWQPLLPDRPT